MPISDPREKESSVRGGEVLPLTERVAVVLCRVETSGNVGSICRAMKTMAVKRLILAGCPNYDEEEVRRMAVHASDVYEGAASFDSLDAALDGFSLSVGFTRRLGAKRKSMSLEVRDFASIYAEQGDGEIALVFGNEKDGLSDAELESCGLSVHIPSSEEFPSLNVAHAVQIACYEVFASSRALAAPGSGAARAREGLYRPASSGQTEAGIAALTETLGKLGFFTKVDSSYTGRFLRDISERARLSPVELDYLASLFAKAAALGSGKGRARRKNPPKIGNP